ncbi:hypothetical protein BJ138DRAFT_1120708 [Hygrophoropsis aurantiaca]|uniref:Uncharacterized protein n=1 Tax=Hygrophoropsis aurantiaca TaxID=72124 RepID=A0ACB7ZRZ9_9AGAM|nr:hypothetical protein BJ138DRAFT_1120708 [Hygrophoropsis aurantiaca]
MVAASRLLRKAHIYFASTHIGLCVPWGTTDASSDDVKSGSLAVIGSDKPTSPWLLMKSNDGTKELFVIGRLNTSVDAVRIVQVRNAAEHFIRYEHGHKRIHIYFEDAETLYCFLTNCHPPRRHDETFDKTRGAGATVAALQKEWTDFVIPCEWPERSFFFRKFAPAYDIQGDRDVSVSARGVSVAVRDPSVPAHEWSPAAPARALSFPASAREPSIPASTREPSIPASTRESSVAAPARELSIHASACEPSVSTSTRDPPVPAPVTPSVTEPNDSDDDMNATYSWGRLDQMCDLDDLLCLPSHRQRALTMAGVRSSNVGDVGSAHHPTVIVPDDGDDMDVPGISPAASSTTASTTPDSSTMPIDMPIIGAAISGITTANTTPSTSSNPTASPYHCLRATMAANKNKVWLHHQAKSKKLKMRRGLIVKARAPPTLIRDAEETEVPRKRQRISEAEE